MVKQSKVKYTIGLVAIVVFMTLLLMSNISGKVSFYIMNNIVQFALTYLTFIPGQYRVLTLIFSLVGILALVYYVLYTFANRKAVSTYDKQK